MRFRLTGTCPVTSLTIGVGPDRITLASPDLRALRAAAIQPSRVGNQPLTLEAWDLGGSHDLTGVTRTVSVQP